MDLLYAYEQQWGFGGKQDIWPTYKKLLVSTLPKEVDAQIITDQLLENLILFLSDQKIKIHLEMSFDELTTHFLNYSENH